MQYDAHEALNVQAQESVVVWCSDVPVPIGPSIWMHSAQMKRDKSYFTPPQSEMYFIPVFLDDRSSFALCGVWSNE